MSIFYGCQVHAGKTQALVPRALAADEGSEVREENFSCPSRRR